VRSSEVDRRRFLKYVGAGAVAVGGAAAAYSLYNTGLGRRPEITIPTTTMRENHPPVANFMRRPYYLKPTDQQTIQFTSNCYDADNDPLQFNWSVDGQPASTQENYSDKLPVGEHTVRLNVSDGIAEDDVQQNVIVEPDQIYPTKQLRIKYKGMRMMVGWKGMSRTPTEVTDEKLEVIRNELGCNAVTIFGNTEFEDDLIEAGRFAIQKGFDRIYLTPMYLDLSIDETVERIGEFASKVKKLREMSESIVFMVGHEFGLDSSSFVPGDTYEERSLNAWNGQFDYNKAKAILPGVFKRIVSLCNKNYGYQITYAAIPWEADNVVPWSDPIFESVGSDAYIWDKVGWTESWVISHLSGLKIFRKPVNSTEWGCMTYKNASNDWQVAVEKYPYDENEQANYIARYCSMLNKAKINGAIYTQIDDERLGGYGLYKATSPPYFGPGSSRKKGFYMYKSYQRAT
jgi:hypothetical protein